MRVRLNPVQERGNVAVVAQVVGGAPVERDRGGGRERERPVREVGQRDLHQFHGIVGGRHQVGHFRAQAEHRVDARHFVPEQPGFQRDLLAALQAGGDLRRGVACGRPGGLTVYQHPEVSRGPRGVQVLHRDRRQQEGVLAGFAVAVQGRRDARHQPGRVDQREVERAGLLRVFQAKGAGVVNKMPI